MPKKKIKKQKVAKKMKSMKNAKSAKPAKAIPIVRETVNGKRYQEFRPVIDKKTCIKCRACFVFCPDSAIEIGKDGIPKVDYEKCKGCLICLRECPVRAIKEERA